MCHPGYPSTHFGCDFNKSEDRTHELNIYKSNEFNDLLNELNLIKCSFT